MASVLIQTFHPSLWEDGGQSQYSNENINVTDVKYRDEPIPTTMYILLKCNF